MSDWTPPDNAWSRTMTPPPIVLSYWQDGDKWCGKATIATPRGNIEFFARVPNELVEDTIRMVQARLQAAGRLESAKTEGLFDSIDKFVSQTVAPKLIAPVVDTVKTIVPHKQIAKVIKKTTGMALELPVLSHAINLVTRSKFGDKAAQQALRVLGGLAQVNPQAALAFRAVNLIAPHVPALQNKYLANVYRRPIDNFALTFGKPAADAAKSIALSGALPSKERKQLKAFLSTVKKHSPKNRYI